MNVLVTSYKFLKFYITEKNLKGTSQKRTFRSEDAAQLAKKSGRWGLGCTEVHRTQPAIITDGKRTADLSHRGTSKFCIKLKM